MRNGKEAIGQDSTAEHDAVRRLNMAVKLLEYRIAGPLDGSDFYNLQQVDQSLTGGTRES